MFDQQRKKQVCCPFSTRRSESRVTHTITPLEVIIFHFQHSVEQMMQTWQSFMSGRNACLLIHGLCCRSKTVCYFALTHVTCSVVTTVDCTFLSFYHTSGFLHHASSSGVVFPDTDHQLCNPPYSAARLINGLCQQWCQSIGCSF